MWEVPHDVREVPQWLAVVVLDVRGERHKAVVVHSEGIGFPEKTVSEIAAERKLRLTHTVTKAHQLTTAHAYILLDNGNEAAMLTSAGVKCLLCVSIRKNANPLSWMLARLQDDKPPLYGEKECCFSVH